MAILENMITIKVMTVHFSLVVIDTIIQIVIMRSKKLTIIIS
jgi:hypothetical protein